MAVKNLLYALFFPLLSTIVLVSCENDEASFDDKTSLAEEILEEGSGFRLGVAETNINPTDDVGVLLGGYGPRYSTGTHDTLTGKCLVMMDDSTVIALISLDLIGINKSQVFGMKSLIHTKTGIEFENIFIHATHTHSGPDIVGAVVDNNYLSHLFTQVSEAALEALNTASNATAIIKSGVADVGNINRRNPSRSLQNRYTLIEFRGDNHQNIASLLNYSCHPVVLGGNSLKISADYVYSLRNEIEKNLGGTALYFNGSFGNINPPTSKVAYPYDRSSGTFAKAEEIGVNLAQEIIAQNDTYDTLDITISYLTKESEYKGKSSSYSILNLGELQIAMIPGEPLELFGEQVMDLFPGPYKMVFGATNDFIAYIVPTSEWGQCTTSFLDECYEETGSDEGLAPLLLQGFEDLSNKMF